MLKDFSAMNPKGHVKLELYNDEGVFFTKEKKNLVVQSANEIVANMMADPSKVLRVSQVDKGDSSLSANAGLLYAFDLSVQGEEKAVFEGDWGSANSTKVFTLEELKGITSLDKVTVGSTEAVINKDVFLKDAEAGIVEFAQAPAEPVVIQFHKTKNQYMKVIAGTETVEVNGTAWKRSDAASHDEQTYQVDYRTGKILFAQPVQKVVVKYDYHMNYSLGFMALGGKPNASHEDYRPVEFGNSDKLKTFMNNELEGSRMPVHYPASVSPGATEMEPGMQTQPIASVQKGPEVIAITDIGDGETKKLVYDLPNQHDSGSGLTGRTLFEVVSVKNTSTGADIKANTTNPTNTLNSVTIQFADEDVAIGHTVEVVYRLKLDNRHLTYRLGQSPVVQLVAVRHINAQDSTDVRPYKILDDGLRPNQGDVWISNPSTGEITFSQVPVGADPAKPAPPVHTPGQIQVEYKVNSGTVVKFVADFPKGVPAPLVVEAPEKVVTAVAGQSAISLDYPIAKDENNAFIEPVIAVDGGQPLNAAAYEISTDGRTITLNSLTAGQQVSVTYSYEKSTHDIYQVAMFDDKVGGKMFNISGIGPVTKDKNTGMRVTWSVTF